MDALSETVQFNTFEKGDDLVRYISDLLNFIEEEIYAEIVKRVNRLLKIVVDADGNVSIGANLDVSGNISLTGALKTSTCTTVSADTDALDVSSCNCFAVDTSGGNVTIGGLANGTNGQLVAIIKTTGANNLIIEHNQATGTQKIFTHDRASHTLNDYGGVLLVFSGALWFEVGP